MRLTCPECGTEYEAPDSAIPAEGRHVQCTACHTRWFARRPAPEEVSEDEILARLEKRRPHLRAVPDTDPDAGDDGAFEWEGLPDPDAPAAADPAPPAPETPDPQPRPVTEPMPEPVPAALAPFPASGTRGVPQPRSLPEQPAAPSPAPRAAAAAGSAPASARADEAPETGPDTASEPAETTATGAPPRPNDTHRLDLTDRATAAAEAVRRERGGFRRGLLIGLALVAAALLLYLVARPVAGAVPLAGGYVALIDGLRADLAFATQN